jgi:phosphoribosylformylglycinamidine synthase PurS subunit
VKIGIKVMPRTEVLDTQGRAVENSLRQRGLRLNAAQVGKYVVLDLPDLDSTQALAKAKEMADTLLCNPLIETFEMEVL